MKNLWLFLFAFLSGNVWAQNPNDIESVTVLEDRNKLNTYGFVRHAADTLDTASLRIVYRLTYVGAPKDAPRSSRWGLLVGSRNTRFYNLMYERADSALSEWHKRNDRILVVPQITLEPVGEVFRDCKKNEFRVIQRFPFQNSYVVEYEESAIVPEWSLYSDTDTVGSYACRQARIDYGGRTWTAWYAPEIPINAGPWKLFGLPGLILRVVDDTGTYAFECEALEHISLPIVWSMLPVRQQTKEKWLRSECGFHMSPTFYFSGGGKNLFYEKGSSVQLGKNWSIPYNPIEWPQNK